MAGLPCWLIRVHTDKSELYKHMYLYLLAHFQLAHVLVVVAAHEHAKIRKMVKICRPEKRMHVLLSLSLSLHISGYKCRYIQVDTLYGHVVDF